MEYHGEYSRRDERLHERDSLLTSNSLLLQSSQCISLDASTFLKRLGYSANCLFSFSVEIHDLRTKGHTR
jgi:hypothetical protein